MPETKKLSHTNIEYARADNGRPGYGWNFFPGCLHKIHGRCPVEVCWAEAMTKRHQEDFHTPHLIGQLLPAPQHIRKPARILVNFMGDLGGDWVDPNNLAIGNEDDRIMAYWVEDSHGQKLYILREIVFQVIKTSPRHTFIFLTKNPRAWFLWTPFPDNCHVGATAWDETSYMAAIRGLGNIQAKVKWISFEPLLGEIYALHHFNKLNWIVIGGQTRPDKMPKIEWVKELVQAANDAGIPVWLKDNLFPLLDNCPSEDHDLYFHEMTRLRQELPRKGVTP